MKYVATLDFPGIIDLYGQFKRGNVYEFKENDTTKLLLKIGYIKEVNVSATIEEKDLKTTYETKELKIKRKKKNA